jgi:hypothetical protein
MTEPMEMLATFPTRAEAMAAAARAMPRRKHNRPYPAFSGHENAWIVWVGNVVLLTDGTMYDHQRRAVVRP